MTTVWMKANLCCVMLVLFHVRWGQTATKAEEQQSNQVFIRFDKVTLETWNAGKNTALIKEAITELVNEKCEATPSDCSLASFSEFSTGDVQLPEKSPLYFNGDVKFTFSVSIDGKDVSGGNDDTLYVIPKSTIEDLMTANRTELGEATSGDWRLDFVGDKRVSPPLDHSVDAIMIPVSIIILLVLILVTVALHFHEKRQEKHHLPTGGDVVLTTRVNADGDKGPGKSDDEPSANQGLLKGEEGESVNV